MAVQLPDLPYSLDALEPHISAETLSFHHGKHHAGYVSKLNVVAAGTPLENLQLDEIVEQATGQTYLLAAQAWNHEFYWQCMSPRGGGVPPREVMAGLKDAFGSLESFVSRFQEAAIAHFGSGWAWLVENDGGLQIVTTHDAHCPLRDGSVPILTCDVWEHAYYLDYRNDRKRYVESWWNVVDWSRVGKLLERTRVAR